MVVKAHAKGEKREKKKGRNAFVSPAGGESREGEYFTGIRADLAVVDPPSTRVRDIFSCSSFFSVFFFTKTVVAHR